MLRDDAGAGLQNRDRANVALRVEQLRHADFFAQNACNSRCHFLLHPAWLALLAGSVARAPSPAKYSEAYQLRRTAEGGCRHLIYLCSLPNALISTSTPAGRSSFISASTVCCVGSRISNSRLCVRISNCSRDFLSTWGERKTVVMLRLVGSGMGPATVAPVLFAVSTISVVD